MPIERLGIGRNGSSSGATQHRAATGGAARVSKRAFNRATNRAATVRSRAGDNQLRLR